METMATELILTTGTNPLPVWVAAVHLTKHLDGVDCIRLVLSPETSDRYWNALSRSINESTGLMPAAIRVDAGNPPRILAGVRDGLGHEKALHLHYTAGTKPFSVHSWEAVRELNPHPDSYSCSYLDPRSGPAGPMIVDHGGNVLVSDCRKGIEIEIEVLLGLHGYTTARSPEPPDGAWADLLFLELAKNDQWKAYIAWYGKDWSRDWRKNPDGRCEGPPISNWEQIAGKLNQFLESQGIPSRFEDGEFFRCGASNSEFEKTEKFINGKFLESAVHFRVRKVLESIGRPNFRVYQSIEPQRADGGKLFELDVVALLGYQLLVISCTTQLKEDVIKLKAMEAHFRATQIGGDEARALVVCGADGAKASKVHREVYADVGLQGMEGPIEVWGHDRWSRFDNELESYFREKLKWR